MRVHTKTIYQMLPDGMELLEDFSYEYEGEVAKALGGGGDTTSSTTVPKFQKEALKGLFSEAERQFATGGPEVFSDQRVAGFDPLQLAAQEQALQFGAGGATDIANQAQQGFTFGLNAADPQANPFFQSTVQGIINPLAETLQQQILPQIQSGAVQAGQVGSSRQGIAEGNAIQSFSRAASDALAKFGSNAFGQGLNTFTQTLAQAPQIQGTGLVPSQITAGVGDPRQQLQQQMINANLAQFNEEQQRSVNALDQYARIIQGGTGISSTTQEGGSSGGITDLLGGAAVGGAIGALPGSIFGATGFGSTGALLGAAIPGGAFLLPALGAAATLL